MAHLIPTLGSARFDSGGELRVAERLKGFLEDNAWVWHNLPVGRRGRHPDFVILHPFRGILVLEVKDWRIDSIVGASKSDVELLTANGPVRIDNPLEQARSYMLDVMSEVKRDPHLVFGQGHYLRGRSILPFGFGTVFTNITRRQFDQTDLAEVFPPERCVFRDDIGENVDPEAFRERTWAMVSRRVGPPLTLPQFDRMRALLFPEIRVQQIALPFEDPEPAASEDRVLKVMDLQQELLARSLGDGHRIVRGVAGSGKTLILAFRAEYLSRAATRPILILCYGNGIAGRLENAMQDRGVEERVHVSTFHSWCWNQLRTYGLPVPSERDISDYDERLAAGVSAVVAGVDKGQIPPGQYDAVLIDEAHDFEPQWLALAAKMVNPNTRSLLVVYDDMQAIYKGRSRPVWAQLGIEAKGRTAVLKVNYRNTAQILGFARRFASELIGAPGLRADDEDAVLVPEDAGRNGVEPVVRKCVSIEAEGHAIAEWLNGRKTAGYLWAQMAVVYPEHSIGKRFARAFSSLDIPIDVVKENRERNRVDTSRDAVRFLSMHNVKGLEFPCVAIGGLGQLGERPSIPLEDDVRLAYVAITRATHEAFLTYSRSSPLVERLIA